MRRVCRIEATLDQIIDERWTVAAAAAIMRTWVIRHQLTSTSDAVRLFFWKELRFTIYKIDAYRIKREPPKLTADVSDLPVNQNTIGLNLSDDAQQ